MWRDEPVSAIGPCRHSPTDAPAHADVRMCSSLPRTSWTISRSIYSGGARRSHDPGRQSVLAPNGTDWVPGWELRHDRDTGWPRGLGTHGGCGLGPGLVHAPPPDQQTLNVLIYPGSGRQPELQDGCRVHLPPCKRSVNDSNSVRSSTASEPRLDPEALGGAALSQVRNHPNRDAAMRVPYRPLRRSVARKAREATGPSSSTTPIKVPSFSKASSAATPPAESTPSKSSSPMKAAQIA